MLSLIDIIGIAIAFLVADLASITIWSFWLEPRLAGAVDVMEIAAELDSQAAENGEENPWDDFSGTMGEATDMTGLNANTTQGGDLSLIDEDED